MSRARYPLAFALLFVLSSTVFLGVSASAASTTLPQLRTTTISLPPNSLTTSLDTHSLFYDAANGYFYVTYENSGVVGVVYQGALQTDLALGPDSSFAVIDSANGYAYFPTPAGLYIVSGKTSVQNLTAVQGTWAAFDPSNGYVYVSESSAVAVISGTDLLATISVGSDPSQPAVDSGNGYVYVSTEANSGSLTVISGTKDIANVTIGGGAGFGLATPVVNPAQGFVYVSGGYSTDTIAVIQNSTLLATVPGGNAGGAYDPVNGYVYLYGAAPTGNHDQVIVMQGKNQLAAVNYTEGADLPIVDASNGYVYVSDNPATNNDPAFLTVLSGTTKLANFTIGTGSIFGYAGGWDNYFDQANGNVYVSDVPDNTVTVVNGVSPTGIVDAESGVAGSAAGIGYGATDTVGDATGVVYFLSGNSITVIPSSSSSSSSSTVPEFPVGALAVLAVGALAFVALWSRRSVVTLRGA